MRLNTNSTNQGSVTARAITVGEGDCISQMPAQLCIEAGQGHKPQGPSPPGFPF